MKAIKHSMYHQVMIDQLKSTIFNALVEISRKNDLGYTPDKRKQYQEFIESWFKDSFEWFEFGKYENIISKMVDEQIDHKSEIIDLWKQIAINTSKQDVSWQLAVSNADHVVNVYERKFNPKTSEE